MVDVNLVDSLQKPLMESGDPKRFEQITAPTSRWEGFRAKWGMGQLDSITYGKIFEDQARKDFPQGPQYDKDPETLNAMFPEVEVPFTETMNQFVAQSIADKAKERRDRQLIIDNSPGDIKQGLLEFAAMGGSHITDPVEFTLAAAATAAVAYGLGVAGMAKVGTMVGFQGLAAKFGISAAGNILSEVPTEIMVAMNAKRNHERYTPLDSAVNVASAVTLGSIIETAGWQLMSNRGGKLVDDINTSKNTLHGDKDPHIYTKHFGDDTPSADTNYVMTPTFKNMDGSEKVWVHKPYGKATMYYDSLVQSGDSAVGPTRAGHYSTQKGVNGEARFKGFAKFTSNADHATAKVLHSRVTKGAVIGVEALGDLKLYDLDMKFLDQNPRIRQQFEEILNNILEISDKRVMNLDGKVVPWEKLTIEDDITSGHIFDSLSERNRTILESEFADILQAEGYDGLTFKNEKAKALETVMFNENKLRNVEIAPVDPKEFVNSRVIKDGEFLPNNQRPETIEQMRADLKNKEYDLGYDEEIAIEYKKLPAEVLPDEEAVMWETEIRDKAKTSRQAQLRVEGLEKDMDGLKQLVEDVGDCAFINF